MSIHIWTGYHHHDTGEAIAHVCASVFSFVNRIFKDPCALELGVSDCTPVEEHVWGRGLGLVRLPVLRYLVNTWHCMND